VLHVSDRPTGRSALLTGDVHNGGAGGYGPERRLAEEYADRLAALDVLDVPKHGSATPDGDVLAATDDGDGGPAVAVLSYHTGGSYDYPNDAAVDDVAAVAPGAVLGTGHHGSVTLTVDGEGIEVEHARGEHVPRTAGGVGGRIRVDPERAGGDDAAETDGERLADLVERFNETAGGDPTAFSPADAGDDPDDRGQGP
jgi:hypothetical protein